MSAWNTSLRARYTSSQNGLSLEHDQNIWIWLPICAPQYLLHLLVSVGPIFAIICGVRKYLAITFHFNSLHVFEPVTKSASEHITFQSSLDISCCISASHLSLICTEFFGFISKNSWYKLEITFPSSFPNCEFIKNFSVPVIFTILSQSLRFTRKWLNRKYLKKSLLGRRNQFLSNLSFKSFESYI